MKRYSSNKNLQKGTPNTIQNKKRDLVMISPKISRNQEVISPRISRNISIAQTIRSRNLEKLQTTTNSNVSFHKKPQPKLLPMIIKRILKEFLSQYFSFIKNYSKNKKSSLSFSRLKTFENLNSAFYCIKLHYLHVKMEIINSLNNNSKNSKFLFIIITKFIKKILKKSFQRIQQKSIRKDKILVFVNKVCYLNQKKIQSKLQKASLLKLRLYSKSKIYQDQGLQKLILFQQKLKSRFLSNSFIKILTFSVFLQYKKTYHEKLEKNKEINGFSSCQKNSLTEEKIKLKKLKNLFETINLQKNRSLNELKKSRQLMKQNNSVDVGLLLQKQSLLQKDFQKTQNHLKQLQEHFQRQQKVKQNAKKQKYQQKIWRLYNSLKNAQTQEIKLTQNQFLAQILKGDHIVEFKEKSSEYLFHQNLQLSKRIDFYENVEKIKQEQMNPEYLRKMQQNKALKNILSTFIENDIENSIKKSQRKEGQMKIQESKIVDLKQIIYPNTEKCKQKNEKFETKLPNELNLAIIQKLNVFNLPINNQKSNVSIKSNLPRNIGKIRDTIQHNI